MSRLALLATLFAAVVSLPACKGKKKDPVGVDRYAFGRYTVADAKAEGRCMPAGDDGLMQCIGMPDLKLGGAHAAPTLYFKGERLVEIVLGVRRCDTTQTINKMVELLGEPSESKNDGALRLWSISTMFVAAQVPVTGTNECEINFVVPDDAARIADLKAGK